MTRVIFVVSSLIFLSACSSMVSTSSLIKQGKWYAVGLRDGERGLDSRTMRELNTLAQENGTQTADVVLYEDGYQTGIDRYCDVNNAYDIGLSGMTYHGVCGNQENGLKFLMDWKRGFADYQSADKTF